MRKTSSFTLPCAPLLPFFFLLFSLINTAMIPRYPLRVRLSHTVVSHCVWGSVWLCFWNACRMKIYKIDI
jgi:hypothetical protein